MPPKTPQAFKTALEERLKRGEDPLHLARQRLVYERFAVRLVEVLTDTMILKGGFTLELRLRQRRTTRDIDLGFWGESAGLLERLQLAGRLDKGDFLSFEVERATNPDLHVGGERFRITPTLASKLFGAVFHLDVAFTTGMGGFLPEPVQGSNTLDFMNLERPTLHAYPLPLHLAEKLHAYAVPREDGRVSSRVRDLPDIALIGTLNTYDAAQLRLALHHCFTERNAVLPAYLPLPPEEWTSHYAKQVGGFDLKWDGLDAVHQAAADFINPVLAGVEGTWEPAMWAWR